jgi:proteasome lid subunit RPN8/RPN11
MESESQPWQSASSEPLLAFLSAHPSVTGVHSPPQASTVHCRRAFPAVATRVRIPSWSREATRTTRITVTSSSIPAMAATTPSSVAQQVIYQGTVNSSVVRAAEVFRPAVSRTCPALVVVHNHPSGDPTPSPEDVRTTEQLRKAGELLDIELLDHIIVGHQRFVSLKERGLGF